MSKKFLIKSLLRYIPDLTISDTKGKASPLVLIVGSPRCGSTIISQYIVNNLKLDYIDNISCIFCFQIRRAFKLLRTLKIQTSVSTKSLHGDTMKYGYLNPSECGDFFYKHFPYGQHEISSLDSKKFTILENELRDLLYISKRPIILKNLANSLRLPVYRKMDLDIKIIYVQRDKGDIINSIIKARNDLKIAKSDVWSIRTKDYNFDSKKGEYDNVRCQVDKIIAVLETELKYWKGDNIFRIHYEHLDQIDFLELKKWLYMDN